MSEEAADSTLIETTESTHIETSSVQKNYFELFKIAVEDYEAKGLHNKLKQKTGKFPYCLYEDIKIILSYAQKEVSKNVFKKLSNTSLSHRSEESIRSRYKEFIQNLKIDHVKDIAQAITKEKGLDQYLLSVKDANGKPFDFLVSSNLKNPSKEKKKESGAEQAVLLKRKAELDPEILINGRKEIKKSVQKQQNEEGQQEEELKEQSEKHLFQQPHHREHGQRQKETIFPKKQVLDERELRDTRELDFYVTFLASYENVQKKNMIHVLDKLSGDLNQLVDYIQTNNQNLLWKDDEDKILANFSQQSPQSIFLLKQLKKGKQNILRRAAYLGIVLPEFD